MNHFCVIMNLVGDMVSIENTIDGLCCSIPFVELDSVNIDIRNEGMIENDA